MKEIYAGYVMGNKEGRFSIVPAALIANSKKQALKQGMQLAEWAFPKENGYVSHACDFVSAADFVNVKDTQDV